MTVLYSQSDDQDPVEKHEPSQYEMEQAAFATHFNAMVIQARRDELDSDERDRERVRKALARVPIVQSLTAKLDHVSEDEHVVAAQQSQEEYEQVRAEIDWTE
ncbi:hypothetical protein [Arthrobacter sp. HMWF013]|uniref:hypothetical protein n=1 Tax=Arthrobacter sp. HMWF013 TaxID=2056849 RepID=UPI000D355BA8|nr:hypothetical protein [Arthrobacter sp. HMWF013]PTT67011.1 hypothetical protein DBR22_09870 [Arthrobacter sp. HMWF013]